VARESVSPSNRHFSSHSRGIAVTAKGNDGTIIDTFTLTK
jgi:hypothetical protein